MVEWVKNLLNKSEQSAKGKKIIHGYDLNIIFKLLLDLNRCLTRSFKLNKNVSRTSFQ